MKDSDIVNDCEFVEVRVPLVFREKNGLDCSADVVAHIEDEINKWVIGEELSLIEWASELLRQMDHELPVIVASARDIPGHYHKLSAGDGFTVVPPQGYIRQALNEIIQHAANSCREKGVYLNRYLNSRSKENVSNVANAKSFAEFQQELREEWTKDGRPEPCDPDGNTDFEPEEIDCPECVLGMDDVSQANVLFHCLRGFLGDNCCEVCVCYRHKSDGMTKLFIVATRYPSSRIPSKWAGCEVEVEIVD